MQVRYSSRELERQCTDERYMKRKLGAQVAKALKLRIAELRRVGEMGDLLLGTGRWEELTGNRRGEWSARLTANWRLIVEPDAADRVRVTIIEIEDYEAYSEL